MTFNGSTNKISFMILEKCLQPIGINQHKNYCSRSLHLNSFSEEKVFISTNIKMAKKNLL